MSDDEKVVYLRLPAMKTKVEQMDIDLMEDLCDDLSHQIEMHRDVIREAYEKLAGEDVKGALKVLERAVEQLEMGDDWYEDEDGDDNFCEPEEDDDEDDDDYDRA